MNVKKSRDARTQLRIWSKLLEGRMALQKVVVGVRDLQKLDIPIVDRRAVDESTVKSVSKLLTCLVRLRDTYRAKSQFCIESNRDVLVGDRNGESQVDAASLANVDDLLNKKHEDYNGIRSEIIEKWCGKTKISTIPKKGYMAMELPTLQLISNAIKDKERLIRSTQLDRTSHLDNMYNRETFNDDDFYHLLLKELISKEEDRKWVELQRTRYKNKRRADTKATKGRKIKKDLIPKLINFMAPWTPANMRHRDTTVPNQIRNELVKSLLGSSGQC